MGSRALAVERRAVGLAARSLSSQADPGLVLGAGGMGRNAARPMALRAWPLGAALISERRTLLRPARAERSQSEAAARLRFADPSAALTRGITSVAINSIERRAS